MLLTIVQRLHGAAAQMTPEDRARRLPNGVDHELQRQYYDVPSSGFNLAGMAGLRELLPPSQLLYGSDEPFNSTVQMSKALASLDFTADDLAARQCAAPVPAAANLRRGRPRFSRSSRRRRY
jgi:hypothetical protein